MRPPLSGRSLTRALKPRAPLLAVGLPAGLNVKGVGVGQGARRSDDSQSGTWLGFGGRPESCGCADLARVWLRFSASCVFCNS